MALVAPILSQNLILSSEPTVTKMRLLEYIKSDYMSISIVSIRVNATYAPASLANWIAAIPTPEAPA
jgi:hypothetical protein